MPNSLPSLNALRAFEAVARHLNYRKAAEELNVTPAATKQLVKKLEQAVGAALFEKQGRGLVLTPVGASGKEGLTLPFQQIADAVERMQTMNKKDRLIVSTSPSFAASWLVPRLERFKEQNPGIDVLIDSTTKLVEIARGSADVGIRFGVKEHGALVVHRLFEEELCAYCSPSLAAGPPKIKVLEDLENAVLLRWDLSQKEWATNTRKWNYWKYWLAQQEMSHIKPGAGIRFTDYNQALQAAIAGQGFIIGSTPILRDLIAANLLINPFPTRVATDIGYDLVTTEAAKARPEVSRFIDWTMEESGRSEIHKPGVVSVRSGKH